MKSGRPKANYEEITSKICSNCKHELPIRLFYKRFKKKVWAGHSHNCKFCKSKENYFYREKRKYLK